MLSRSLFLALALTLLACGGSTETETADGSAPDAPPAESPGGADTEASESKPSGAAGPCDLLTTEEIAAALGTDAGTVSDGGPGPFPTDDTQDCEWTSVHDGIEDTVTLWMRSRGEKTVPDGWSNAIRGLIENGETIGSQTLSHEPTDLGGVTGGALSSVHGSAFVKSRIYSWQIDEETYYRLTIARSLEEGDELPDPPAETFGQLVEAILD